MDSFLTHDAPGRHREGLRSYATIDVREIFVAALLLSSCLGDGAVSSVTWGVGVALVAAVNVDCSEACMGVQQTIRTVLAAVVVADCFAEIGDWEPLWLDRVGDSVLLQRPPQA